MALTGAQISQKVKEAIKAKLVELGSYVDDELPDYIMVMVANKKTSDQMKDDLGLFLGPSAAEFVNWLFDVMKRLQSLARTKAPKTTNVATVGAVDAESTISTPKEPNKKSSKHSLKPKMKRSSRSVEQRSLAKVRKSIQDKHDLDGGLLTASTAMAEVDDVVVSPKSVERVNKPHREVPQSFVDTVQEAQYVSEDVEKDEISQHHVVASKLDLQRRPRLTTQATPNLVLKAAKESSEITLADVPAAVFDLRSRLGSKNRKHKHQRNQSPESSQLRSPPCKQSMLMEDHRPKCLPPTVLEPPVSSQPTPASPDSRSCESPFNMQLTVTQVVSETKESLEFIDQSELSEKENADTFGDQLAPCSPSVDTKYQVNIGRVDAKYEQLYACHMSDEFDPDPGDDRVCDADSLPVEEIPGSSPDDTKFIVTLDGTRDLRTKLESKQKSVVVEEELFDLDLTEEDLLVNDALVDRHPIGICRLSNLNSRKTLGTLPSDASIASINQPNAPEDGKSLISQSLDNVTLDRCKFWPTCKKQSSCPFFHPSVKCDKFPNCKFGDKCLYIHPQCKFASKCSNFNCPYAHHSVPALSLPIASLPVTQSYPIVGLAQLPSVCKFFPQCKKVKCPFQHPKVCNFGGACTKRSSCPFFHPVKPPPRGSLKWSASKASNVVH